MIEHGALASGGRQPPGNAQSARDATGGLTSPARQLKTLHRDERGTVSVVTLWTILGLVVLLGMIINVGRHVDDKIRMQNAADAGTYSGGVVLARGMNALSFSNHLLCDVFALTAFMREARDRNAEQLVPDILTAWSRIGPIFSRAQFPKFQRLGPAIMAKVPLEQEAVRSYSEMSYATSELVLPVLEYVLRERLIPEFERAVVQTMPRLAQQATNEVARRQGVLKSRSEQRRRKAQVGVLWRPSQMLPVGYPDEQDPLTRTLPAVDPTPGQAGGGNDPVPDPNPDQREGMDYRSVPNAQTYLMLALEQRDELSRNYLEQWTADRLRFFELEVKMSQFINLWRIFTCGQLNKLLCQEYPQANVPHVIRLTEAGAEPAMLRRMGNPLLTNQYLDRNFMFVGVALRRKMRDTSNKLFKNPLDSDPVTFAQVHLFVPRARMWNLSAGGPPGQGNPSAGQNIGGGLGIDINLPIAPPGNGGGGGGGGSGRDLWVYENWPGHWDLLNQNWTAQLVPATHDSVVQILQTAPPPAALNLSEQVTVKLPYLGQLNARGLRQLNTH